MNGVVPRTGKRRTFSVLMVIRTRRSVRLFLNARAIFVSESSEQCRERTSGSAQPVLNGTLPTAQFDPIARNNESDHASIRGSATIRQ